jgi:hypothetical protein
MTRHFTRDEDGQMQDRRSFNPFLSRYCAACEEDLGDYYAVGTMCDGCATISPAECLVLAELSEREERQ